MTRSTGAIIPETRSRPSGERAPDRHLGRYIQSVTGADINGRKVVNATTASRFGYMVWDRLSKDIWSGTLFDVDGKPIERCRLADRLLSCGS